jgi:Carboxypeptidase regulatory-like domain
MRLGKTLLLFFTVLILSFATLAQNATTMVHGTVMDPKGAVIPGATVTIVNRAVGYKRDVTSGADGSYQVLQVPPGTYDISADAKNVGHVDVKGVQLLVNQPSTLNLTMQLAGQTTTIEVKGEAPTVNTQDATIGHAFNSQQILSLPFEGRNAVEILSLQPGAVYTNPTSGTRVDPTFDSRNGSVNGARSDQTNVTIDGLDNNDPNSGSAFEGALRTTLDSIQEFRVTTTNANAEVGRSSGAQVVLVTKSGTNNLHGSLYEDNRSDIGEANDWFNKQAQVSSGFANRPPKLIRNTFGGSIGGPIVKDRFFGFFTYEGQRRAESLQVTRVVPSADLRNGIIHYIDTGGNVVTLTPAQIASMDTGCVGAGTCPWGPGPNPNSLAVLQSYPLPNTDAVGDTLNFRGFTFSAPTPGRQNTFIGKLDLNVDQGGNHKIFVRGNLMDDHQVSETTSGSASFSDQQQFPGMPNNATRFNNSKGVAIGYTAILGTNLINSFRYAFTRIGTGVAGIGTQPRVTFRGLDDPVGFHRSSFASVPMNNLIDDVTLTKGKHILQFGGNLRIINNNRLSNDINFFQSSSNPAWLASGGIAGTGGPLDPGNVASSFGNSYDQPLSALLGTLPEITSTYNQDKNGTVIPQGALIPRHFKGHEGEIYAQDSWRIKPNLTVTGGLRYTLLQPPYEIYGNQAAPSISMSDFLKNRAAAMFAGQTYRPTIQFDISGQANGKKPYWDWDYGDIAPRVSIAYSPSSDKGLLGKLFGGQGKTSIRAGWGIYYDHFGEGIVNTFDQQGSFGLTTQVDNAAGFQTVDCAPRFTGSFDVGGSTGGIGCGGQNLVAPPPGPFPVTPPTGIQNGSFAIYWGLDDKLKTPYSHAFDASIQRELKGGFVMELAYVGRLGRRLLQQEDLAMPLNIVDPSSHIDYFGAMQQLDKLYDAGTPESAIPTNPYWENLFPAAAGAGGEAGCASGIPGSPTATQNIYDLLSCGLRGNETTVLEILDFPDSGGNCFPACATINGQQTQGFQFFHDQFSSLYAWRSIGNSTYNAAQIMFRHPMTHGVQFDFNYTLSRSYDYGSSSERIGFVNGPTNDQIINTWNPKLNHSFSDFDALHQINTNFVLEVPVGRTRKMGGGMGRVADAFVGGWDLSGLAHWSSGLPFSVDSGFNFPTNWELEGNGVLVGPKPKTGQFMSGPTGNSPTGFANVFRDGPAAFNAFRLAYAGEAGDRNNLRGPGYFGLDMGLGKKFRITEQSAVNFSWQVFNVFNNVRFDALSSIPALDTQSTFGNFNTLLTRQRIMQFGLSFNF